MYRARIKLDTVAEHERNLLCAALVEGFAQSLHLKFPTAHGFIHSATTATGSWNVTRGPFWGLEVNVVPDDASLRSLRLTIHGFFPLIHRVVVPFESAVERIERLAWPAKSLLFKLLLPLLLIPVIVAIPFMALYRLATLSLWKSVAVAGQQLETIWPQVQATTGTRVSLNRARSPFAAYFLGATVVAAAAGGSFWMASLLNPGEAWRVAFFILGSLLAILCFGLLIGSILIVLGVEVGS